MNGTKYVKHVDIQKWLGEVRVSNNRVTVEPDETKTK